MTLLDILIPRTPPEPINARVVSFDNTEPPAKWVEDQKRAQREHWRKKGRPRKGFTWL